MAARTRWLVVGAGTAGVVAASRLAEHPRHEVALLEAGPAAFATELGDSFFDALAAPGRTIDDLVASRVDGGPPLPYRRGRGVGGSGVLNAMVALAGGRFAAEHRLYTELPSPAELGCVDRALITASAHADRVPLTRRDGRRLTVVDHYPLDAVDVRGDAPVDRVLLDGRRAVGVRLVDGTEILADHVVLSAGAIASPTVLLRSGVDVPGIGHGLKDHPAAPITLALRADSTADPSSLAVGSVLQRDPIQVLPLNHLGRTASGYGVLMPALMRVRSEGSVRLNLDRPDDPTAPPRVDLRMLSHPDDIAGLVDAVALALELLEHPAFGRIVDASYVDDVGTSAETLDSADAIAAWLPEHVGDYVHASCTCRMGVVVDEVGAVRDHHSLYVCDASVFPDIPEVNTNVPTAMLAETLVGRWLAAADGD